MLQFDVSPVPGNTCIYCGTTGVTNEHIIPQWLGKIIGRSEPTNSLSHKLYGRGATIIDEEWSERPGDGHTVTVRRVCKSCNGGWMSKMQATVKPLIIEMLSGDHLVLHRLHQTRLAAWSAMTFMNGDFRRPFSSAIPQEDRTYLLNNQLAPRSWYIWIGRYERSHAGLLFAHNSIPVSTPGYPAADTLNGQVPPSNTQSSTVIIGDIFLTCISSSARDLHNYWQFNPRNSAFLSQIWPIRSPRIAWPPPFTMNDQDAVRIANAFFYGIMKYDSPRD